MRASAVDVWEEYITLPTYVGDAHCVHPQFDELHGQACYPYPYADLKGDRHKVEADYLAVHMANELLEVIFFPHFGGRIYSCRDKISGHDIFHPVEYVSFSYMGTAGGTYVGCGVELSFPDHHSITHARKREYRILRDTDGSASIVMGELDLRMRMRWEAQITLRPGAALLEQETRVHNRTAMYGRGRYWGNAGMAITDGMEISYPETLTYEHGGEYGIGSWPVYDGVDMRFPKRNVPLPIGMEMKDVREGWYAFFDHDRKFGMVHWAPADETPAKKYWTWGSSQHGPHRGAWFGGGVEFLELQSGRVEDQEEFEIYPPFSLRRWREVWYPIRDIGAVDGAGRDVALSCKSYDGGARVALFPVRSQRNVELIAVDRNGGELARTTVDLEAAHTAECDLKFSREEKDFRVHVVSDGKNLTIAFERHATPRDRAPVRICDVDPPEKPRTADDFMMDYERMLAYFVHRWPDYETALTNILAVDPNHQAAHRWLGIWLIRRGLFDNAEEHLDRALARCPRDGEAQAYKGVCRLRRDDAKEAEWRFKMAFKNGANELGAFMLGVLAFRRLDLAEALERFNDCIDANGGNLRARVYRALLLARTGDAASALADVDDVTRRMPNEPLATVARAIIGGCDLAGLLQTDDGRELARQLRKDVQAWLELVCDLLDVGLLAEALQLAGVAAEGCCGEPGACLIEMYRGYLLDSTGRQDEARECFGAASEHDLTYAFTFRDEELAVLDCAQSLLPENGLVRHLRALIRARQARYLEAFEQWEQALSLGFDDAVVLRAMAGIAARYKGDSAEAESLLDRALAASPGDLTVREDLLSLVKARGDSAKYGELLSYPGLESTRLVDRVVNHLLDTRDYDGAVEIITEKAQFPNNCQDLHHVYELALDTRAFERIKAGDFEGAEQDLRRVFEDPPNLGLPVRRKRVMSRTRYFLGVALRGQGREEDAREQWEHGVREQEFATWMCGGGWVTGLWTDRYWQGRMLLELGRRAEARGYFEALIERAQGKSRTLGAGARRELYALGRAGLMEAPITGIATDTSYLALE